MNGTSSGVAFIECEDRHVARSFARSLAVLARMRQPRGRQSERIRNALSEGMRGSLSCAELRPKPQELRGIQERQGKANAADSLSRVAKATPPPPRPSDSRSHSRR